MEKDVHDLFVENPESVTVNDCMGLGTPVPHTVLETVRESLSVVEELTDAELYGLVPETNEEPEEEENPVEPVPGEVEDEEEKTPVEEENADVTK